MDTEQVTVTVEEVEQELRDILTEWMHDWIHVQHKANDGACLAPHQAFMFLTGVMVDAYEEAMYNLHREEECDA